MLKEFRENPKFLTQYHLRVGSLLLIANIALCLIERPELNHVLWFLPAIFLMTSVDLRLNIASFFYCSTVYLINFETTAGFIALCLFGSACLSLSFSTFIHNASHDSFSSKGMNRLMGELMGLIQ